MIRHIPRSSRIFIGLLAITLLLTYIAMTLAFNQNRMLMQQANVPIPKIIHETKPQTLDTSDWIQYTDKDHQLSFSYPKEWKIKPDNSKKEYSLITLDIPNTASDINIYISKTNYMGLEGLNQKPYTVDNVQGVQAGENLVGIKTGEYYYTFDGTLNLGAKDEFYTLLGTVKFGVPVTAVTNTNSNTNSNKNTNTTKSTTTPTSKK